MKKTALIGFAISLLMLLLFSCLNQKITLTERWQNLAAQNEEEQTSLWQDDLERYARLIIRKHRDPYTQVSEETFQQQLQEFRQALPEMKNVERYGELLRMTALLQDGHSQLNAGLNQRYFPFKVQSFTDGIYVIETDSSFKKLLGNQILMIGSEKVEDILPRLSPYISATNSIDMKNRQVHSLENAELLALAGILDHGDSGVFTFKDNEGETLTLLIPSSPEFIEKDSLLVSSISGPDLDFFPGYQKAYSLAYIEESGILFFQYNTSFEREDYPFDSLVEDIRRLEKEKSPRFLVMDFRYNQGGNSRLMKPLLKYLIEESGLNRRGRLFAAIGRDTYGSAMVNLMELEKETQVLFIGEKTSEKPNHFGEEKSFLLPNTGIEVFYPTKFYPLRERVTPSLEPQIPVEYSFEDYLQGIDPLLQMIREQAGE